MHDSALPPPPPKNCATPVPAAPLLSTYEMFLQLMTVPGTVRAPVRVPAASRT